MSVDWTIDYERYLLAKESIDDRSIHPELWRRFEGYLHEILGQRVENATAQLPVQIVDVGAGLGSLLFRLLAHWQRPEVRSIVSTSCRGVRYWAIDQKAWLLRALLERLQALATAVDGDWCIQQIDFMSDSDAVSDHSGGMSTRCMAGSALHRAEDELFRSTRAERKQPEAHQVLAEGPTKTNTPVYAHPPASDVLSSSASELKRDLVGMNRTHHTGLAYPAVAGRRTDDLVDRFPNESTRTCAVECGPMGTSSEQPIPCIESETAPVSEIEGERHDLKMVGSALILAKGQHNGFYIDLRCLQGDALEFCVGHPQCAEVLWASSFFDLLLGDVDGPDTTDCELGRSLPLFLKVLKKDGMFYFPLHYDGTTYWEPSFAPSSAEDAAERYVLAAFHRSMGDMFSGRSGQALLHVLQRLSATESGSHDMLAGVAAGTQAIDSERPCSGPAGLWKKDVSATDPSVCGDTASSDPNSSITAAAMQRMTLQPRVLWAAPSTWFVQPFAGLGVYLPSTDAYFLECILKFVGGTAWVQAQTTKERVSVEHWFHCRFAQQQQGILTYVAHNMDLMGMMMQPGTLDLPDTGLETAVSRYSSAPITRSVSLHPSIPGGKRPGSKTEPAGVFSYGTLQSAKVLESILGRVPQSIPAALYGYQIYGVCGESYPAIAAVSNAFDTSSGPVAGKLLVGLSAEELALLDAYEGPQYRKLVAPVHLAPAGISAEAYVYVWCASASDLVDLPDGRWDIHHWIQCYEGAFCTENAEWISSLVKEKSLSS
ncbi:hypothetical protein F1559_002841 [Cyanidiococcus yangmingshanensis]|uniref:Putative gamma-glutamylcyclotransferase n=1 Tax=Cyanidiococcus yangmingshanensis TaxID=2690220 RepID=A0A7J7IFW2_9RHOD|nr:hypothetical protein F1559_002841 [Cyanidiococcus yangmingshanensis]